jgi:hypothetical protein
MEMMIKFSQFSFSFLIATIMLVIPAFAQNTDLRARVGASFSFDISNNLGASVEVEQRFKNNMAAYDKTLIEPDIHYNINKKVRIGFAWRTMYDTSERGYYSLKHRGSGYLRYRIAISDFDFRIKSSLQYGVDDLTTSMLSTNNNLINRNALTLRYNWFGKPITPEIGCELYYHMNNPRGSIINQFRMKAGIEYRVNKKTDITLYYLFDNEFNIAHPTDSHVLGLFCSYKL